MRHRSIIFTACAFCWMVLCLAPGAFPSGATRTANAALTETEQLSEIALPKCGFWSSRGVIWSASYANGVRLEVWCRTRHWFAPVPVYRLLYFTPDGRRHQLARCPFWCGCNTLTIIERRKGDHVALEGALWDSVKGRASQRTVKIVADFTTGRDEPAFDEAAWVFSVSNKQETVIVRKYAFLNGYKRAPCGCAIRKFKGQLVWSTTRRVPW
jgi:hypothetical protein